ncbi:hypothetical protein D6858_08155 [Tsuneonella suprasediminis]|uniref:D-serine dehydratase-like domain-containing protein n=1 Tax=Tsuneonella suprasediminis TaxID=2306996 RepID=A0A419R1X6_9SPHN|nr:alanine racemase [Tsuneonella suprasediminis]RJX67914.1 hypothetical protein D6858_08155 [Tsuneonella suprasediminis]
MSHDFDDLNTPCLLLDRDIIKNNIARMASRASELGVALRPHIKTPKSISVAQLLRDAGAAGFTTSTIRETEYLAQAGFDDLFYAVPSDGRKAQRIAPLLRAGKNVTLLVDTLQSAEQIAVVAESEQVTIAIWVEIDVDHYRTGIDPKDPDFDAILALCGKASHLNLAGIMSYGGASYGCATPAEAAALTERHRRALLAASDKVQAAGLAKPRLSFGSSPAVLHADTLDGIDEVRCGIYTFQDLFQAGIGACTIDDIAVTVLATVISHGKSLNRFTVDAGALALSKDRSTQGRSFDAGFGLVCDADTGKPIGDLQVGTVSQELGLVTSPSGAVIDLTDFPIGKRVRILPNHADMTAAAYDTYHMIGGADAEDVWTRTNGWESIG